jgi:hypothetical protein
MVFAHILGVPVEETALTFAPVIVVFIAAARGSAHHAHRKLRAIAQRGLRRSSADPPIDSEDDSPSAHDSRRSMT